MFGLTDKLSQALAIAVILLTIAGYILFNGLVDAKAKITTLETANKDLIAQIEINQAIQDSFELSHRNIVLHFQEKEEQAKKDSAREHVAAAKPTLVEKLANKKFKEQERRMACLTGNQSKC